MHILFALLLAQFAGPAAAPVTHADARPEPLVAQARGPSEMGAPSPSPDQGQVLVRIQGDAHVPAGERVNLMIVVDGDARVEGTVDALAVIRGDAVLQGARVGEMMVAQGRAVLGPQTVVAGDLRLRDARLEAAPGAVVMGQVSRDGAMWQPAVTIFGALAGAGIAFAFILAGILAAALAPRGVRRAGASLTGEIGKTLLAALIVWIAVPVLAGFATFTVVATPISIAIFAIVLPALAILGYLIAGIRVGDAFLTATRQRTEIRPIGAAAIGLTILLILSIVPYLGPIIATGAALIGGGALGLTLWRRARSPGGAAA